MERLENDAAESVWSIENIDRIVRAGATLHTIAPVYDKNSKILILGSFPSVKSRETGFFYGHPQNRFWTVLSAVFHETVPDSIDEKKRLLQKHHIALWDVIQSCEIAGSSDASIRNVVVNDFRTILDVADIDAIYVNGKTAFRYYQKYVQPNLNRTATCLPSTSPANAAWDIFRLIKEWKVIAQRHMEKV